MIRALAGLASLSMCLTVVAPAAADVVLEGVSASQAANIKAFLSLSDLDCDAPPWLVRWQGRQAPAQITSALEALGYYNARIVDTLDFPTDGCWRAQFRITPGEPEIVREVDIKVDAPLVNEVSIAPLLARARNLKDKQLNHETYEAIKRGLLEAARTRGYFSAAFKTSVVQVDVQKLRATVVLDLVGGPRYAFGDIEIIGDFLARRLVDTYIPFHTGEPFDAELVTRLRRNLADSGYFGRSFVSADPDTAVDHAIPIRIELYRRSRAWTYSLGAGYASDTGPRIRVDAENNLLNVNGHRASIKSVISTQNSSLDMQYRIPHITPLNDWFIFDAGLAHLESNTSSSNIKRVGARHTYERGKWVETDFADLTYEDFKIADQYGDSRLVLLGTTLNWLWRDRPTRPTEGYRIDTTFRGASQALGSDTDLFQTIVSGEIIEGLTDTIRVIMRSRAGWTWKDKFSDLPPTIRFFAGGAASIRGYAFQGVGPERDGNVVGGSRLLTGSLEFDYQFRTDWAAALFVDSGSAYDDAPHFVTGVGAGLRWYSPVGPIRIDVAHPLDDPSTQLRFYITIGPDL